MYSVMQACLVSTAVCPWFWFVACWHVAQCFRQACYMGHIRVIYIYIHTYAQPPLHWYPQNLSCKWQNKHSVQDMAHITCTDKLICRHSHVFVSYPPTPLYYIYICVYRKCKGKQGVFEGVGVPIPHSVNQCACQSPTVRYHLLCAEIFCAQELCWTVEISAMRRT